MQSRNVIDLRNKRPQTPRREPTRPQGGGPRDRRTPLRTRRRRVRTFALLICALVLAALAYGLHFASYMPQFTIQNITVNGTMQLQPELVERYIESQLTEEGFRVFASNNIFLYPRAQLENAVASHFPLVNSVSISRPSLLSTTMLVNVQERTAFARWCAEDECALMDDSGYIFTAASTTLLVPSTQYVFAGGFATGTPVVGKTFEPGHVPGLLALLRLLENARFTPLGATMQDEHDFAVPLNEGFFIKVSFGSNPDVLVRNLQLVLNSEVLEGKQGDLEYIDLRFGNRVYYKLKGEEEVQA